VAPSETEGDREVGSTVKDEQHRFAGITGLDRYPRVDPTNAGFLDSGKSVNARNGCNAMSRVPLEEESAQDKEHDY
jgi:hypothetical protein